jgi:hypothetical protein
LVGLLSNWSALVGGWFGWATFGPAWARLAVWILNPRQQKKRKPKKENGDIKGRFY